MYDELKDPIPSVDLYLKRLNMERTSVSDLKFLDAMILGHQYSVPFENLDSYEDKVAVSLATNDLFDKIVNRKRGGYCFELNSLFNKALKACGFNARPYLARVVVGDDFHIPSLHRLTVVTVDGNHYVCDVGFGGAQPGFALKIEDGFERTDVGQTFRVEKNNDRWQILHFLSKEDKWETTMEFFAVSVEESDFVTPNYYCSTHSDAMFVTNRVINLRIPNGSKSIFDNTFAVTENGNRTEAQIENDNQLKEILSVHFGIER